MASRKAFINEIERRLGRKKLIWCGTRGEDARPLLALSQFSEVYSLIAPINSVSIAIDCCLERTRQRRNDLDTYSLDRDESEEAHMLRRSLLDSLKRPTAIVPYRPLAFLTSVYFPRMTYVDYLGLFHERQAPFEHKPWVESELQSLGIQTIPWRYFSDEDRRRVEQEFSAHGQLVIRENRSDGGAGFSIVRNAEDLEKSTTSHPEGFFAVAPLLLPHVPVNVNACVFPDGEVTIHGPSLQLLGIPSCTTRPFGYCGNDFAAIRDLPRSSLTSLQHTVELVGRWLASKGYVGAFGVDAMIYNQEVRLVEVNPRFQGSSALSAAIDEQMDMVDLFLAHIGAFLGLKAPKRREALRDIAVRQEPLSQVIVHNTCSTDLRFINESACRDAQFHLVPGKGIRIAGEAILFKAILRKSVTNDGFSLSRSAGEVVNAFATNGFTSGGLKS